MQATWDVTCKTVSVSALKGTTTDHFVEALLLYYDYFYKRDKSPRSDNWYKLIYLVNMAVINYYGYHKN